MEILRVINNNVVSALDKDAQEVVIMGKGVGFQVKPGQKVNPDRIEKTFRLEDEKSRGQFTELLKRLPMEYLRISDEIITYAKSIVATRLNPSIYVTLTDHIGFAIDRSRDGMLFGNPLLDEVQIFYPGEFLIGEYAVALIERELDVSLGRDEAASIALHVVNAEYNTGVRDTMNITFLIRDILDIVKEYLNITLDEESLHYSRFITHLKFLGQRIFTNQMLGSEESGFQEVIQKMYPAEFACSEKIAAYIQKRYEHSVTEEEMAYLAVHIRRIQPEKDE